MGYGLLDAGKAMQMVEQPWNMLSHFGNTSSGVGKKKTLEASGVLVHIVEDVQDYTGNTWIHDGDYLADVYRIDAHIDHSIEPGFDILAYWPRHSSSTVLEAIDVNGDLRPRERVSISFCDETVCLMSGYVYMLYDIATNDPVAWLPFDVDDIGLAHFEYSILSSSLYTPVSVNEHTSSTSGIELFPNPTMDGQTLKIQAKGASKVIVNLYDAQGRYVRNVYNSKAYSGDIVVQSNISDLAPALYFYSVEIDEQRTHLRFIKQ